MVEARSLYLALQGVFRLSVMGCHWKELGIEAMHNIRTWLAHLLDQEKLSVLVGMNVGR